MGREVVQGIVFGLIAIVVVVSIGSYIGKSLSHHGGGHGDKSSEHHETEKNEAGDESKGGDHSEAAGNPSH